MAAVSQRAVGAPAPGRGAGVTVCSSASGTMAAVAEVVPEMSAAPAGVETLAGPGLPRPGRRAQPRVPARIGRPREKQWRSEDFWTWRDRMYSVAGRITPEQLQAIAAQLYGEMLAGGYTQVCEFHYLQHQPDGAPLRQPARWRRRCAGGRETPASA